MEMTANREHSQAKQAEMVAQPVESEAKEAPQSAPRGFPCRWCKSRNTTVRKTYSNQKRKRFCRTCQREFLTIETAP